MFAISGHVQNYAWGPRGGLNPWLADDRRNDEPQAELWFGAHANGPSPLVDSPGSLAEAADGQVPLLVKLLAAERPLSIQLHPAVDLAEGWYAAGSDLIADPLAKVEMLIALEPFAVFAGWRDPKESAGIFHGLGPAYAGVVAHLDSADVRAATEELLRTSRDQVSEAHQRLMAQLQSMGVDDEELHSHALAARAYPDDPGVLALGLLDHHLLRTHEAVYMPVGGVHAYVQGLGLEVMTASDNVLRLGLTHKPVAVAEALSAVRNDGDPHFLGADASVHMGQVNRFDYHPDAAPFAATVIRDATIDMAAGTYRLVLCLRGETHVRGGDSTITLHPGQACAILAHEDAVDVHVKGTAAAVRATD